MEAYSFHIAFCHRSHIVVCFVLPSCCTTAGSEPVALLHCRIQSHTAWLLTVNRCCIVYLHLIRSFVRSVDLLDTNYGRSAIGVERPILIPSIYILCIFKGFSRCSTESRCVFLVAEPYRGMRCGFCFCYFHTVRCGSVENGNKRTAP